MEWDAHSKVRQATTHAPDDEVPPPPRGGDRLRLVARVPHTPETAWEALHNALYLAQVRLGGASPWHAPQRGRTTHQAKQRLLMWPTDPADALQVAEETLGIVTKQVFQLTDTVPTSKPDVPATREHPLFIPGHAPV